ncbi:hypothetical protein C0J52_10054 [Blattella germanica]|nr:hypothetical protein C0J52_10054 [Blattella germanica]
MQVVVGGLRRTGGLKMSKSEDVAMAIIEGGLVHHQEKRSLLFFGEFVYTSYRAALECVRALILSGKDVLRTPVRQKEEDQDKNRCCQGIISWKSTWGILPRRGVASSRNTKLSSRSRGAQILFFYLARRGTSKVNLLFMGMQDMKLLWTVVRKRQGIESTKCCFKGQIISYNSKITN